MFSNTKRKFQSYSVPSTPNNGNEEGAASYRVPLEIEIDLPALPSNSPLLHSPYNLNMNMNMNVVNYDSANSYSNSNPSTPLQYQNRNMYGNRNHHHNRNGDDHGVQQQSPFSNLFNRKQQPQQRPRLYSASQPSSPAPMKNKRTMNVGMGMGMDMDIISPFSRLNREQNRSHSGSQSVKHQHPSNHSHSHSHSHRYDTPLTLSQLYSGAHSVGVLSGGSGNSTPVSGQQSPLAILPQSSTTIMQQNNMNLNMNMNVFHPPSLTKTFSQNIHSHGDHNGDGDGDGDDDGDDNDYGKREKYPRYDYNHDQTHYLSSDNNFDDNENEQGLGFLSLDRTAAMLNDEDADESDLQNHSLSSYDPENDSLLQTPQPTQMGFFDTTNNESLSMIMPALNEASDVANNNNHQNNASSCASESIMDLDNDAVLLNFIKKRNSFVSMDNSKSNDQTRNRSQSSFHWTKKQKKNGQSNQSNMNNKVTESAPAVSKSSKWCWKRKKNDWVLYEPRIALHIQNLEIGNKYRFSTPIGNYGVIRSSEFLGQEYHMEQDTIREVKHISQIRASESISECEQKLRWKDQKIQRKDRKHRHSSMSMYDEAKKKQQQRKLQQHTKQFDEQRATRSETVFNYDSGDSTSSSRFHKMENDWYWKSPDDHQWRAFEKHITENLNLINIGESIYSTINGLKYEISKLGDTNGEQKNIFTLAVNPIKKYVQKRSRKKGHRETAISRSKKKFLEKMKKTRRMKSNSNQIFTMKKQLKIQTSLKKTSKHQHQNQKRQRQSIDHGYDGNARTDADADAGADSGVDAGAVDRIAGARHRRQRPKRPLPKQTPQTKSKPKTKTKSKKKARTKRKTRKQRKKSRAAHVSMTPTPLRASTVRTADEGTEDELPEDLMPILSMRHSNSSIATTESERERPLFRVQRKRSAVITSERMLKSRRRTSVNESRRSAQTNHKKTGGAGDRGHHYNQPRARKYKKAERPHSRRNKEHDAMANRNGQRTRARHQTKQKKVTKRSSMLLPSTSTSFLSAAKTLNKHKKKRNHNGAHGGVFSDNDSTPRHTNSKRNKHSSKTKHRNKANRTNTMTNARDARNKKKSTKSSKKAARNVKSPRNYYMSPRKSHHGGHHNTDDSSGASASPRPNFKPPQTDLSELQIQDMFFSTLSRHEYQIISIKSASSPTFRAIYSSILQMKSGANKKQTIEQHLFYGCSSEQMKNTIHNGFDRSSNTASLFGTGIYFGRHANAMKAYALKDEYGYQHLLLCRVIVGTDFCKGSASLTQIPVQSNGQEYDCMVDDVKQPTLFVISKHYHAISEYLIKFKLKKTPSNNNFFSK